MLSTVAHLSETLKTLHIAYRAAYTVRRFPRHALVDRGHTHEPAGIWRASMCLFKGGRDAGLAGLVNGQVRA